MCAHFDRRNRENAENFSSSEKSRRAHFIATKQINSLLMASCELCSAVTTSLESLQLLRFIYAACRRSRSCLLSLRYQQNDVVDIYINLNELARWRWLDDDFRLIYNLDFDGPIKTSLFHRRNQHFLGILIGFSHLLQSFSCKSDVVAIAASFQQSIISLWCCVVVLSLSALKFMNSHTRETDTGREPQSRE